MPTNNVTLIRGSFAKRENDDIKPLKVSPCEGVDMTYRITKQPAGNRRPVIIEGARTAFVKSYGAFEDCDALELFSRALDGLLRRVDFDPEALDEVIAGVVVPQNKNPNVARDAVLSLGLPKHIHGYTLNRACTSSLQTIADAAKTISFGHPNIIVAGGVECLSDVPIVYSKKAR